MADKNIETAKNLLQGLLTEGASEDMIRTVATISSELDKVETTIATKESEVKEMRKDYIDMVKKTSFKEPPSGNNGQPPKKEVSDFILDVIAKRGK